MYHDYLPIEQTRKLRMHIAYLLTQGEESQHVPKPGLWPDSRPFRPTAFSDSGPSRRSEAPTQEGFRPWEATRGGGRPGRSQAASHLPHITTGGNAKASGCMSAFSGSPAQPSSNHSHLPVHFVGHKQASTSSYSPDLQSLLAWEASAGWSPSGAWRSLLSVSSKLVDLPYTLGQWTVLLESLRVQLSQGLFILVSTSIPSVTPSTLPSKPGEGPPPPRRNCTHPMLVPSSHAPLPSNLIQTTNLGPNFWASFITRFSSWFLARHVLSILSSIQRGEDQPWQPAQSSSHPRGSCNTQHPTGRQVGSADPWNHALRPLRPSHWGQREEGEPQHELVMGKPPHFWGHTTFLMALRKSPHHQPPAMQTGSPFLE